MSEEQKTEQTGKKAKKEKQKKSKRRMSSVGRIIIRALFAVFILGIAVLVFISLRNGLGSLDSSKGKVEADEEKVRAFEASQAASTETEETAVEEVDTGKEMAEKLLYEMTPEQKVYQLFITSPDELTGRLGISEADGRLNDALQTAPVGGLILYEANVYDPEQVASLLSGVQENASIPLFFGIDGEPGNDEGLSKFGITAASEAASVFGTENVPEKIRSFGKTLGTDMKAVGFNLDFAPVADVLTESANTTIGTRSFSSEPDIVSSMVSEMITGLHEANIMTCTKFFPGLAGVPDKTYVSEQTMDELRQTELPPFQAAIERGTDMILISHLQLPAVVDDGLPCSLSPIVIQQILRGELGYEGLIVTDSLQDKAISELYDSPEAAVLAIQAGCDMLLLPDDPEETAARILEAMQNGDIPESRIDESVLRILLLKIKYNLIAVQ